MDGQLDERRGEAGHGDELAELEGLLVEAHHELEEGDRILALDLAVDGRSTGDDFNGNGGFQRLIGEAEDDAGKVSGLVRTQNVLD